MENLTYRYLENLITCLKDLMYFYEASDYPDEADVTFKLLRKLIIIQNNLGDINDGEV